MSKLKVTLKKSLIGRLEAHKASVKGLGLTGRLNQQIMVEDTLCSRGMIEKVRYLLTVEDGESCA